MGAETLSEADRAIQAIWASIWFGVILVIFFFLTHRGADGAPMRWQRWWWWFRDRYLTSSAAPGYAAFDDDFDDGKAGVTSATTRATTPNNRIATPNNGDNRLVTDNEAAIFQGKVAALATLIQASKVGQAEGIELVFKCSRSSRADSPYQRARAALLPLLNPPPAEPKFGAITPEQQALRDDLGLRRRS